MVVKAKRKKRKKEKLTDYLSNKEFTAEVKKWKRAYNKYMERCKANNEEPGLFPVTDEMAEGFYKIARGLSNNGRFRNYKFKEDMIQVAMLYCCKYAHNFKLSSNNAFSYFSQICWNGFVQTIKKEYRFSELKKIAKDEFQEDIVLNPETKMNRNYISKIKNF